MSSEVIIYTDENGEINLDVSLENETVWLNQKQMGELFSRAPNTINEHIKKIYKEEELEEISTTRNFRIVQTEGKREVEREVIFYNLDMIISVGYKVSSKRATQFRKWATKILKNYLIKGYALNQKKLQETQLNELTATIELIKNSIEHKPLKDDEAKGLFEIINNYAKSWALLQSYDEDSLQVLAGTEEEKFILDYDEARAAILDSAFRGELFKA